MAVRRPSGAPAGARRGPGRLLAARSLGNGACTVRVPLTEVAQVDVEVTDLLREADAANG